MGGSLSGFFARVHIGVSRGFRAQASRAEGLSGFQSVLWAWVHGVRFGGRVQLKRVQCNDFWAAVVWGPRWALPGRF